MEIFTYISVAPLNAHVNEILSELLDRIEHHGLYDESRSIKICVNDSGDERLIDQNLLNKSKYELIRTNKPYEFGALELLWSESLVREANFCYVHTKGISRVDNACVSDWRRYMSHFILDDWQRRVEDLEDHHCSGVNLQGDRGDLGYHPFTWGNGRAPLHYSGNFWWSRSDHLGRLPSPTFWTPTNELKKWRMMNEMWLCQIKDSKYKCVWNSGVNHYHQRYEEKNYNRKEV